MWTVFSFGSSFVHGDLALSPFVTVHCRDSLHMVKAAGVKTSAITLFKLPINGLYRRSFLTLRKITILENVDFCYKSALFDTSKKLRFHIHELNASRSFKVDRCVG